MLALSSVDHEFEPRLGQTKDLKLLFVASPLSTQRKGIKVKNGWL